MKNMYSVIKQMINHKKITPELYDGILNFLSLSYPRQEIKQILDDMLESEKNKNVIGERNSFTDVFTLSRSNEETNQFDFYCKYMQQKIGDKSVLKMKDSLNEISTYLGDPQKKFNFSKRGLVFGQVQSGKTAHYIGLMHKVADLGYENIIVLTSNDDLLRQQTQERIEKDLLGYERSKTDVEGEEKIGIGLTDGYVAGKFCLLTTNQSDDMSGQFSQTRINVIVVKKKSAKLKYWLDKFNKSTWASNASKVVIDDEADWGSVNAAAEGDDPKKINALVRGFLKLPMICYIAYTATPFSNLFSGEQDDFGLDIYPKDFIAYITPGEGYMGFNEYFLTDDEKINIINLKIDDYVDDINLVENSGITGAIEEALKSQILNIYKYRFLNEKHQPSDLLINVSRLKENHTIFKNMIEVMLNNIQNTFDLKTVWFGRYRDFGGTDSFDEFSPNWDKFTKMYSICKWAPLPVIANSTKESNEMMKMVKESREQNKGSNAVYKSFVFIGGNKLSRGLTFEFLSDVVFFRNINQYDSSLQMARWFGYHSKLKEKINLFTSDEIINDFTSVSMAVDELQTTISEMAAEENGFEKFNMKIRKIEGITPTQKSKMRNAISELLQISFAGRTISETDYYNYNHDSRLKIVNGLSSIDFVSKDWGLLSTNVNFEDIKALLLETNLPNKQLIIEELADRKINLILRSNKTSENGTQFIAGHSLNNTQKNNNANKNVIGYKLKTLHTSSEAEKIPKEIYEITHHDNCANIFIYPFVKTIDNNSTEHQFVGIVINFGKSGYKEKIEYIVKEN